MNEKVKTQDVVGVVTSCKDGGKAGKVKAALAATDGSEYPEGIAPVWMSGWCWPPENGDAIEVHMPEGEDLVEYAHEVRWRGVVYAEGHGVPEEFKANYPQARGFKTKEGNLLLVDDKDKIISVKTKKGHELLLDEKNDKVSLRYKDTDVITINASGIFFGTESASEPFVLRNLWKTMMDTILAALAAHIHPTGVGPSGPPTNASVYTGEAAKTAATISDFIKGQKAKP